MYNAWFPDVFLLPVCVPSIACRISKNPQTSLESIGPTVVTHVGNEEEHLQLVTHKHHTQKVLCYAIFVVTVGYL